MKGFLRRVLRARIHLNALTMASPDLPADMPGLRIAVAADIQAGGMDVDLNVVDDVVDRINTSAPDIVLMPGEFAIHGRHAPGSIAYAKRDIAQRLSRISSRLGTFAVLGNHDWEHGESEGYETRDALEAIGIHVLENRNMQTTFRLEGKTHTLNIVGLSDFYTRTPDMSRAFDGVAKNAPVILLSHNPKVFEFLNRDVALMVAGHTHGGQVRPLGPLSDPLLRCMPTPIPRGRWLRDKFVHHHGPGFISQGIGTSELPFRFACRRQVDIIDFIPEKAVETGLTRFKRHHVAASAHKAS